LSSSNNPNSDRVKHNPKGLDAFAGTADDYARHRPAYPDAFLAELRAVAQVTGQGALLDLACGPGRVATPLARCFRNVLAVDVEPGMIEVGKREAGRRGVTNIAWQVGRAEDVEVAAGSIELITIGDAFHRLDQQRTLTNALRWLQPRGSLASLSAEAVWRGDERWKRILVAVVNAWTDQSLRDANAPVWGGPGDTLRAAGLTVVDREVVVERVWTCDSIVGFMFATSIASRRRLGDNARNFEAELRTALLDHEPHDRFVSQQRFGFTVGTKDEY
jgi:SAM-dependent methyltransferase